MPEKTYLLYVGIELTSDDTIRSKIQTVNPFYVLADMLLKAKKPYGMKPNRNKLIRNTTSSVTLGSIPVKDDRYMKMMMTTSFIGTDDVHSLYGLNTLYSDKDISKDNLSEYTSSTSSFYKGPSYDVSLKELAAKLEYWSRGNLVFAKILSSIAAASPEHPFWKQQVPGQKGSNIAYKTRWNHTNWSGFS